MSAASEGAGMAVSVSRLVPADPDTVWTAISDVTTIGDRSPETTGARWLDEPPTGAPSVGARFKGRNRIRFLHWSTVCTVTEARPGRTFGFSVAAPSGTSWRYDLTPVEGGTQVTESMFKPDRQLAPIRWMQRAAGVTDRAEHLRGGMTATLDNLAAVLTANSPALTTAASPKA